MKRFIVKVLVVAIAWLFLFGAYVGLMPMDRNNYMYMLNVKDSLMQNTPSPRVIMVAGSCFAFGLDSERIADSLGVNVVNAGLHAGVGMKYIMDDVLQYVREGDVVVIGMEYAHLFTQMYGDATTLGPAMYYTGFRNMHLLNDVQRSFVYEGIIYAVRQNKKSLRHPEQNFYSVKGFNRFGDEVGHLDKHVDSRTLPRPSDMGRINEEYCNCLKERVEAMEKRGARVLFVTPPLAESSFNPATAQANYDYLKSIGHKMLMHPEDTRLPDSLFWDTHYHLNRKGVDVYNGKLIDVLKSEICED